MPDDLLSEQFVLFFAVGFFIITVLLIIMMRRQAKLSKRSEDTILGNFNSMMLSDRGDRQAESVNQVQYLQNLLYSQSEATANRMDALGARLDQANLGQEDRLRGISKVLDERLAGNDRNVERMRETLYQGVANMQKENAQKHLNF